MFKIDDIAWIVEGTTIIKISIEKRTKEVYRDCITKKITSKTYYCVKPIDDYYESEYILNEDELYKSKEAAEQSVKDRFKRINK